MSSITSAPLSAATYPVVTSRHRVFFAFIGAFLFLAPLSISGLAIADELKWARVGVLGLCFVTGLHWFRMPRAGDLSFKVLMLSVVFCISAVWSSSPIWGLLFKGMLVCAIASAIALANCLRTQAEFRSFLRTMTLTSSIAAVGVAYLVFVEQSYEIWKGRLILAEMNANTMGISAALFALLCGFHLVVGDTKNWQRLAWTSIAVMVFLVIYSGSRAAALTLVCGPLFLFPSISRDKRQFIVIAGICIVALAGLASLWYDKPEGELLVTFESPSAPIELRLLNEMTKETRTKIWVSIYRKWLENPFSGRGLVSYGESLATGSILILASAH